MSEITPLRPGLPTHVATAAQPTWLRVVAPATPLDAALCTGVLAALHATRLTLMLEVRAERQRVDVGIKAHPFLLTAVSRAIRGAAPAWDVGPVDPPPRLGRSCYIGWLERPVTTQWAPLRGVGSFDGADPLNALLEAVQELIANEQLIVRFLVNPARRALRALIYEAITMPSKDGPDAPREPRFGRTRQRPLEARLHGPAFEVIPIVALAGNDRDRLLQRARSVDRVFRGLYNAGFGGLEIAAWGWGATPQTFPTAWPPKTVGNYLTADELAALWHPASSLVHAPGVAVLKRPSLPLPLPALGRSGVAFGIHRHRGSDRTVHQPLADLRTAPMLVLGKTGAGKSTFLHSLARQLLVLPEQQGLCLIDPNWDLARDIATFSIPAEREAQTFLFEFDDACPEGLPVFAVPPNVSPDAFVAATFSCLKLIFADAWSTTRMEDAVFAITATLCRRPSSTLLDVPRLLADATFRRQATVGVTDPVAREFWRDFGQLSDAARRQLAQPILYRVRSLYRTPAMRHIVCRTDGPDFGALLDAGTVLLFSLANPSLSAEADLLGELLISRIHLALQGRLRRSTDQRRPVAIVIDESQRFSGGSLPILLREGRKLGAAPIVLATQYLDAWGERLAQAVAGNLGTLVAFRSGPEDARKLRANLTPFTPEQLEQLDRFEAIVKYHVDGASLPAIDVRTLPIDSGIDQQRLERIRAATKSRFGRPRADIEAALRGPESSAPSPSHSRSPVEIYDDDSRPL